MCFFTQLSDIVLRTSRTLLLFSSRMFQVVISLYFLAALGRIISGMTIAYAGKNITGSQMLRLYIMAFDKDEGKEAMLLTLILNVCKRICKT